MESVQQLFKFVEQECELIFSKHSVSIPSVYHKILPQIRQQSQLSPFIHWKQLQQQLGAGIDDPAFQTMLQYFTAIGKIIWLPSGIVITDPTVAPKIAAKFVSPTEVRLMLLKREDEKVQILEMSEVGCLLDIDTANNERLTRELELMVHLNICYELRTAGDDTLQYLFPSLSLPAGISIPLAKCF